MPKFTEAQNDAITKSNTSIIVSAGAGSGKTTVLKERVLRILKEGHNINELIILTFTKNAAAEMKERIRKIIKENDDVKNMLEYLDTANITTFDSYANSLVKKYSELLNISDDFIIVDDNIVKTKINDFIDEIFENYYINNVEFQNMIKDFEIKNDEDIRNSVKKIYSNLNKLENKEEFLKNYINKYYNIDYLKKLFEEYEEYILNLRDEIIEQVELLNEECDIETKESNEQTTDNFKNATSYDELITCEFKLKAKKADNYSEKGLEIKTNISNLRKKFNELLKKGNKKELINQYKSTEKYAKIIIEILKELDIKVMKYKNDHNAYEFQDIELLAIKLLETHEDIKNEIKNNTYEIMIDEYQDTNDIQEKFVSLIEKNNVYMVGDIKQSIYRFRNANPYIFKNKYDQYKNNINGYKIDLKENFRSRKEVIYNINLLFDYYMFNNIGGADYKNEHEMKYGNKNYLNFNLNKDYNFKIYNYEKNDNYTNIEQEGFIIANDIINRINNKEQIVYEEKNIYKSRNITYNDFVILIDKSKNFEDLKKILEANNIPTIIDKSISIKEEDEIYILKNIINMIICIRNNNIKKDFRHSYMSIARSYLYNMNDEELFKIIMNENYKNTEIYIKCEKLLNIIDSKSNKEIINEIINEFNIIEKLTNINNINERITKLEYFIKNANNLNDFGLNIYKLNKYFDEIIKGDNDIKMDINTSNGNAVKIMTIHASKGLEYPIVYIPFINSNFFKSPSTELMTYSNTSGLIIPFYDNGKGNTIAYTLDKYYERKEIISEKIRLFYVALTRAKEKFIIINQKNDKIKTKDIINQNDLLKYESYSDFINALSPRLNKYIELVNVNNLNINKNINEIKTYNYKKFINKSKEILNIKELNIDNKILDNKHFSKALSNLITNDLKNILEFGTYMHYVFEVYNFKTNNINELNINNAAKEKINNFLNHDEVKNIREAKFYKEHEIRFEKDGATYHGFIDLLLEYEDHFDIIDYKLSNIDSPEYKEQLSGYKNYIENNYNKPTNIYLYSINKDKFKKL